MLRKRQKLQLSCHSLEGVRKGSPLETLEEAWTYQQFDFDLLVSRTVRDFYSFRPPSLW